MTQEEKDVIAAQITHYKDIRPVVQFGQQYRLINPDAGSNEAAVQFNYENKVLATYVRVLSTVETVETTLKLKNLDQDANYILKGTGQVYSGAELMMRESLLFFHRETSSVNNFILSKKINKETKQ